MSDAIRAGAALIIGVSPTRTLITHTKKSLYLCRRNISVCMYVAIRRPRVYNVM